MGKNSQDDFISNYSSLSFIWQGAYWLVICRSWTVFQRVVRISCWVSAHLSNIPTDVMSSTVRIPTQKSWTQTFLWKNFNLSPTHTCFAKLDDISGSLEYIRIQILKGVLTSDFFSSAQPQMWPCVYWQSPLISL